MQTEGEKKGKEKERRSQRIRESDCATEGRRSTASEEEGELCSSTTVLFVGEVNCRVGDEGCEVWEYSFIQNGSVG